jgi:hypothetical protein
MNILDQIFNLIDLDGALKEGISLGQLSGLHPMAERIITMSFRKQRLWFTEEDMYLLSSEIETVSEKVLYELSFIELIDGKTVEYSPAFSRVLDLILDGDMIVPSWAGCFDRKDSSWSQEIYDRGRYNKLRWNWILQNENFHAFDKDDIRILVMHSNIIEREYINLFQWLTTEKPELGYKTFHCEIDNEMKFMAPDGKIFKFENHENIL